MEGWVPVASLSQYMLILSMTGHSQCCLSIPLLEREEGVGNAVYPGNGSSFDFRR